MFHDAAVVLVVQGLKCKLFDEYQHYQAAEGNLIPLPSYPDVLVDRFDARLLVGDLSGFVRKKKKDETIDDRPLEEKELDGDRFLYLPPGDHDLEIPELSSTIPARTPRVSELLPGLLNRTLPSSAQPCSPSSNGNTIVSDAPLKKTRPHSNFVADPSLVELASIVPPPSVPVPVSNRLRLVVSAAVRFVGVYGEAVVPALQRRVSEQHGLGFLNPWHGYHSYYAFLLAHHRARLADAKRAATQTRVVAACVASIIAAAYVAQETQVAKRRHRETSDALAALERTLPPLPYSASLLQTAEYVPSPPMSPPPEPPHIPSGDRTVIDHTAAFVARNGPLFERKVREEDGHNPKFAFLMPHHPHCPGAPHIPNATPFPKSPNKPSQFQRSRH
jgi:hypothetical protein